MPPRYIGNNPIRRDRLSNDPTLLLNAPMPAANNIRVVTNVDHNLHTNYDPKRIAIVHYADSVRHVGKEHRLHLIDNHRNILVPTQDCSSSRYRGQSSFNR
jgi:hypothetical protein